MSVERFSGMTEEGARAAAGTKHALSKGGGLMRRVAVASLLGFALLAAAACEKKAEPRLEVKSEAKSTSPDGAKTTTTTETLQVGSTLAGTTETKDDAGRKSISVSIQPNR